MKKNHRQAYKRFSHYLLTSQSQTLINQIDVIESIREADFIISLEEYLFAVGSEAGFPLPTKYKQFLHIIHAIINTVPLESS